MPKQKKKTKKKIGRPNPFVYYLAYCLAAPYYKLKYRVSVDRSGLKDIKGPALVLCPHISNMDHIMTAIALFPHRPTYVLSEHFMMKPILRFAFGFLHIITKKMFCADGGSVMSILRAVREKNIIVLFPEGRLTWYGRSLAVTEGTYELIKKLKIDVYTITGNGAYLSYPKWSPLRRRGRVRITTEKVMSGEEIAAMSMPEVRERLDSVIRHDEEKAMDGVRYTCRDMTLGLDGILWYCPKCGGIHTLKTEKSHIICQACGLDATLDEYYRISGAPVKTVNEWYELCASTVDLDTPLESEVRIGTTDKKTGNLLPDVGRGHIKLDRDGLHYSGTFMGEELTFDFTKEQIPAFPITVGVHFDIYLHGRLIYIYPEDGRDTVRFVTYLDRLTDEARRLALYDKTEE